LHVFPNSNAADFRHSQVPHGITHRITLRIEHGSLRHDDDLCFHFFTIFACVVRTSAIQKRDYFKTTTSNAPSRRSTLTPTSPASCLVAKDPRARLLPLIRGSSPVGGNAVRPASRTSVFVPKPKRSGPGKLPAE